MALEEPSETFLKRSYDELISVCTKISDYRWVDSEDLAYLRNCIEDVAHWTSRVQAEARTSGILPDCLTAQ